jgi:hypothetical protein
MLPGTSEKEIFSGSTRYCLFKNPIIRAKEGATRKALIEKTAAELDKIVGCTSKT